MPGYQGSQLQQWQDQQNNPAAPEGLKQSSQAAAGYASGTPGWENSRLGQLVAENGYTASSSGWFNGQNLAGTNNGWDNDFTEKFVSGWDKAAKEGTLAHYFDSPTATGVVTYDHAGEDAEGNKREYKFGDVYKDGQKVSNLFDDYDAPTANRMILPWLGLDGTQQARIFGNSDVESALDNAVQGVREKNKVDIPKSIEALAFQGDVEKREKAFEEGFGDEAVVGGATVLGGATSGAAAATIFGPEAIIPGAIIGGTTAFVGSLLNKDELTERAARAYEITKMSFEDNGVLPGLGTAVSQAGQTAMSLSNTAQNLVHGAAEVAGGGWGDSESEFYKVDDKGRTTHGPIWQTLGLAAAVADGAMQFASPLGRNIYLAEMGATTGGEVAELAFSGGMSFNPRSGQYDNIFTDDDGNFDPVSGLAGIGKIGIDAVQTVGLRGLAGQVSRNNAVIRGAEQEPLEAAGHRFITDEMGNITGMKKTVALLAPSEQVQAVGAARLARIEAMNRAAKGGSATVTADDFYNAAMRLANGDRRLKAAMLNAFGEGYEEAAQSVLEPISQDGKLSFHDMAMSFFYGAAGGLGMGLGATGGAASADERMYAVAKINHYKRFDGADLTPEQWSSYSPSEKRIAATMNAADIEETRSALERMAKDQYASLPASTRDMAKAIDSRRAAAERELSNGTDRTDSFTVISGILSAQDSVRAEAVEASAAKVLQLLEDRSKGLELQQGTLERRLAQVPEEERPQAEADLRQLRVQRVMGEQIGADVENYVRRIYDDNATADERLAATQELNHYLEAAFDRGFAATDVALDEQPISHDEQQFGAAQFVSLLHSREPKLDAGSYLALMPRASWDLTRTSSDNLLLVNMDVLQAINGDFDGDMLRAENQVWLSNERYLQARGGQFFGGVGQQVDIATRNFDEAMTAAVGQSLKAEPGEIKRAADAAMGAVEAALIDRYGDYVSDADMDRVLSTFRTEVEAGNADARTNLISNLARVAGENITLLGRETLTNEWLYIGKLVRAKFQEFQRSYSALRNQRSDGPTEVDELSSDTTPEGVNRRKRRAVTDAQTLAIWANGNTLFRQFQKIHYTWYNSAVLGAENTDPNDLLAPARFYEQLAQGITRSQIEQTRSNDTVAGRVLVMLGRLVDEAMRDPQFPMQFSTPQAAMMLLANVKVKNVWWDKGRPTTDGRNLSLVQVLLGRALDAEREEFAKTWATDEKLQAKHRRLRTFTVANDVADDVNAEKALVEVFGAIPFGQSLGQSAPPTVSTMTTPEQWLSDFEVLDEAGRTSYERLAKSTPEYLDRKETSNPPYSLQEMDRGEITPYRVMLDAMMAVGRRRQADRQQVEAATHQAFRDAHALIRDAMRNQRQLMARLGQERQDGVELVQEMFDQYPAEADRLLALVPDAAANALFEYRDDQLYVAPWLYETFAMEDADEALMHYFRNLVLAQYNSTQEAVRDDAGKVTRGRRYNRLNSRFQRMLYELSLEPGRPGLELLMRQMAKESNLERFMEWVNTTPGIRGRDRAPLLAFHDDVADFEADGPGGWVQVRTSTELREAVVKLRDAAKNLNRSIAAREEKRGQDAIYLKDLLDARNGDQNEAKQETLRKFTKAVSVSQRLPRGFGPAAMLALTRGAMRGFDEQSTDKGRTPPTFEPIGEFQALMDAFAFVPGLERVMEAVTAHSLNSLASNLGDTARVSGEAMDSDGRPVSWEPLDVDTALDMLADPKSAPLALSLLTPAFLEISPNGTLSERLLNEASLTDLIEGDAYKAMYRRDAEGHITLNQAMQFLMVHDAATKNFGGSLDTMKFISAVAIAKTSALDHPATPMDEKRLSEETAIEVAEHLMMIGRIMASPTSQRSGVLEATRTKAREQLLAQRAARKLPAFVGESGSVVQDWVDTVLADLEAQKQAALDALLDDYNGAELTRRSASLEAQYDQNADRIRALLDDALTASTVERFRLTGDETADSANRESIERYVRSMAGFGARAPESSEIWSKLVTDRDSLTSSEWEQLSRSAMGVYLADRVVAVSGHVSVPAFPKGDPSTTDAPFFKYFDTAYSWVIDDLYDQDSPMTQAATWMHTQLADLPAGAVPSREIGSLLNRTLLRRNAFGPWTPGLMSQIVEAHQRLDSSAAPSVVAMAGNGQKRWGAIAAATRRTAEQDSLDRITTLGLGYTDLLGDPFGTQFVVTQAGQTQPQQMPLAMLNGRFVSSIRIEGEEIPLHRDNLGFQWRDGDTLRYISVNRLTAAVEAWATRNDRKARDLRLEIDFLHPDSKPPEQMNNAYFDGMAHDLLPDGNESLIATLWVDNGGMLSTATQAALDAGKRGVRALMPFQRPTDEQLLEAKNAWEVERDFAKMLRLKTAIVMQSDQGNGPSAPEHFNSIYKTMKLQHLVVGTVENVTRAWTAEQVLAMQAAGEEFPPDAHLVVLSPDVLRTMLGDTGTQGTPRFFNDEYVVNLDEVKPYTGVTEEHLKRFGAGWMLQQPVNLAATPLANVGQQRVLRVRTIASEAEINRKAERILFLNGQRDQARVARAQSKLFTKDELSQRLADIIDLARQAVGTERQGYSFGAIGAGWIAARNPEDSEFSRRLLDSFLGSSQDSFTRGFIVQDEGAPDYPSGVLTIDGLSSNGEPENQVVKDDVALVVLDSFERPERDVRQRLKRVQTALEYLANRGATVVLGSGNARGDLRYEAAEYLQSLGYVSVAGSKHVWQPAEFSEQTQNERAYESTMLETQLISPARNAVTFLAIDPIGIDENAAILGPRSTKLRDRKLVRNMVPSSRFRGYNLPIEDNLDRGPYGRALQHLRNALRPDNTDARAELVKMAGPDLPREMPIETALDRFYKRITETSYLTPQPGDELQVGDIIPFMNPAGKIILYRHGFTPPEVRDLPKLQKRNGMNIALGESRPDQNITRNSGIIREITPRAGIGRQLVLEVPLQPYGDKVQLEWNGMKYVVVPPDDAVVSLPTVPVLGPTELDLVSDLASAQSKEADFSRVHNYRNALSFFQFNFLPDMTKFFFPAQDENDPVYQQLTTDLLDLLSRQTDARIPTVDAAAIANAGTYVAGLLGEFAQLHESPELDTGWLGRLEAPRDATDQIAYAVITYLLTEGAVPANIMSSEGFSHRRATTGASQVRRVPGLFADLLDQGVDAPLHAELIRRFDGQLNRGADNSGFRLHPDWTVEMFGPRQKDGSQRVVRGYLQFGEAHSSGDNPVLDGQAYDWNESSSVSAHNAAAVGLAVGGVTAHKMLERTKRFARSFLRDEDLTKFSGEADGLWAMLTATDPDEDGSTFLLRRETAAETVRRAVARQEIIGFFGEVDTHADGWNDDDRREYTRLTRDILLKLNLKPSQAGMVDTWVRQFLGRPKGSDDNGVQRGEIIGKDAVDAARNILDRVNDYQLPTAGAAVPLIDVNQLTTIFMANMNRSNGWSPATVTAQNAPRAGASWDAWVETALGSAFDQDDALFESIYLLAVDGFMHGYQGATTSTRYLPVSSDILRQKELMDPETNRMLVSISADENLLATDPVMFNSSRALLEDIISGHRIYSLQRGEEDPSSAKGRQAKRILRWRIEEELAEPTVKRMRGVRKAGQSFVGHTQHTSAFFRTLINLRAGNTLFNIPLIVMAPIEAFWRRSVNMLSNVAVGESTGALGRTQSRLYEAVEDKTIGGIAKHFGLTPTYTSEEQTKINQLIYDLSTRPEFKAMIYKELMYQYPSMPGIGKIEKALEKYAKLGGRLQDPAWGMLPRDLSRIYVESVLENIAADPTGENIYSVDMLLKQMARNPGWVNKNDLSSHNMAIARIANIRSLKPTVLSLAVRGVTEPLSENPKFVYNAAGNLLKTLTLFQNFWANYAINITGLQGAADFAAMLVDARPKKLGGRLQAAISGRPYNPEVDGYDHYDMSEVLEAVDLADSFIRGGVTHSALFAFGLMAGGLGLSGDDDESKWRRRQAELQGAAYITDPRKLQNDISNKDGMFLDWLPPGIGSMFRVPDGDDGFRRIGQMNFLTRSVFSPIIGMERFYNTGDFTEVLHGYKDAIGAHPLVNEQIWNVAAETMAQLHEQAVSESEKDTPESHARSAGLLMTAVGIADRMFLENSMVNMVYVGTDRYDRDPFKLPKQNGLGQRAEDVRGNPYATDATREFTDPVTGETREGYITRDGAGAQYRTLSENRFGMAFLGSLWDGLSGGSFKGSDYFRKNMVVKTRDIELLPADLDVVEADILAAFKGAGGQPNLTELEAADIIKKHYRDAGVWYNQTDVEKMAKQYAAHAGQAAMSMLNEAGREVPTDAGAQAIFRGLQSGTVKLGDAALNGVFVSYEQRAAIQEKWMKELVQEGISMGMSQAGATSRMKRIWFGPLDDKDAVGLYDIVFTKEIPFADTLTYNQLNTTYITGPDGWPRATGFKRDGLLAALGLMPLRAPWSGADTGLDMDERMNTVDSPAGVNTGFRALERVGDEFRPPLLEQEIRDAAEKIADAIGKQSFTQPYQQNRSFGGGGYSRGRRGYGGGGGGYYSGGGGYFTRMNPLPESRSVYGNSIPFINTSNPIVRRADVRRERVWSERGRLKQWQ